MDWLPEDKEILVSKIDHLKNYWEELKSFSVLYSLFRKKESS